VSFLVNNCDFPLSFSLNFSRSALFPLRSFFLFSFRLFLISYEEFSLFEISLFLFPFTHSQYSFHFPFAISFLLLSSSSAGKNMIWMMTQSDFQSCFESLMKGLLACNMNWLGALCAGIFALVMIASFSLPFASFALLLAVWRLAVVGANSFFSCYSFLINFLNYCTGNCLEIESLRHLVAISIKDTSQNTRKQ